MLEMFEERTVICYSGRLIYFRVAGTRRLKGKLEDGVSWLCLVGGRRVRAKGLSLRVAGEQMVATDKEAAFRTFFWFK